MSYQNTNKAMKTKLIITTLLMVVGFATNAQADDDRPIQFDQLPKRAQQFLTESFPGDRVSYAKMERDLFDVSYEVILVSGTKIEFVRNGDWKEISTRFATIDAKLIPQPILEYVKQHHANRDIVAIEREHKYYEVKLTDGMQLRFDRSFRFIGWDD